MRAIGRNATGVVFAIIMFGVIFAQPELSAQADEGEIAAESNEEPASSVAQKTKEQAEDLITKLSSELVEAETLFATNSALLSEAESESRLFSAELEDETREVARPAIDGFINSGDFSTSDDAPTAQLRARYIGSQIISQDEEALAKIRTIQERLELSESKVGLLAGESAELEAEIDVTAAALTEEHLTLGRINERAIYERGREGPSRTLVEVLNNGRGSGTYLATCPVSGPHNAIDSWLAPRSGGRQHQGVDIMASIGVPVVAPASGNVVLAWGGNTGGNVFRLTGDNGVYYYGSHLNSFEGGSRRVEAGEVIGYVGKTGNARYTPPHLHFEIRPGGRGASAINPTPDSAVVCSGVDANKSWRG